MISITEIVLIIAGFAAIILGYLLPVGKELDEEDKVLMEREIRELVRREVEGQKETIENMVDDSVEDTIGRTERTMERISNEKLSAINEYSDTVMSDIHKNHDEVMFMYDMLNDKHKNLTSVVSEVTRKADEARQTVLDAELTVKEAQEATNSLKNLPKNDIPEPIKQTPEQQVSADQSIKQKSEEPLKEKSEQPIPVVREPELNEIKPKVIVPDEVSNLHIIGNDIKDKDDAAEHHVKSKVVPITEAVRVEGKSVNPDKNMQELTANDPISQNRQIIEMHKAGKSNMVIARELGLGIGEVKLVIDLSNKHRKVK